MQLCYKTLIDRLRVKWLRNCNIEHQMHDVANIYYTSKFDQTSSKLEFGEPGYVLDEYVEEVIEEEWRVE